MAKIPTYHAKLTQTNTTGIFAMSFVDYPANETNFVALSKRQPHALKLSKAKQVLTGVVLIPDQEIYRDDENGKYNVVFKREDIELIAQRMMLDGVALRHTTHQHADDLKGNYLTELWIVQDSVKDKANALGLGKLPVGTLCASYKIVDADYWRDEVLTGNVKGFSIEGFFNFNEVKMTKKKTAGKAPQKRNGALSTFMRSVATFLEGETAEETADLVDEAKKDEVDAGTPFIIFDLADGSEVHVDADGYATIDGEAMPAGDHELADGNIIVIDESSNLVVTTDEAEADEPAEAEVAMAEARKRGKAVLAKQGSKDAKIKKLERELANLKKAPSTKKKTAKTNLSKVDTSTHTGKLASLISSQRKNMGI